MNINLITLNTRGRVDFNQDLVLTEIPYEEIRRIDNLHVDGYIVDNGTDYYDVHLNLKGSMTLISAINGSDVKHEIDIKFDDFIENLVENYKNSSNTLDILPIIWENIYLEIPIRAINSEDTFDRTSGTGWELISEED